MILSLNIEDQAGQLSELSCCHVKVMATPLANSAKHCRREHFHHIDAIWLSKASGASSTEDMVPDKTANISSFITRGIHVFNLPYSGQYQTDAPFPLFSPGRRICLLPHTLTRAANAMNKLRRRKKGTNCVHLVNGKLHHEHKETLSATDKVDKVISVIHFPGGRQELFSIVILMESHLCKARFPFNTSVYAKLVFAPKLLRAKILGGEPENT